MRDILAPDGTIYVHCDWRVSGYLRLVLNELFGGFITEISWQKSRSVKSQSNHFSNIKDSIFIYSRNPGKYVFDPQYVPKNEKLLETPFFNDNPLAANFTGECTWYCWGRAREKTNTNDLPTSDAGNWFSQASGFYKITGDPISNSIACFSGGHVVFVEEVCNGTVYFSEANYYSTGDSRRSNGQYEVPPNGTDGQIKSATISAFKTRSPGGYQGCIVL